MWTRETYCPSNPAGGFGVVYGNQPCFGPEGKDGRSVISPRNPAPVSAGVPGLEPRTNDSRLGFVANLQQGKNSAEFRGCHENQCTRWHGQIRADSGHLDRFSGRFWSGSRECSTLELRIELDHVFNGFYLLINSRHNSYLNSWCHSRRASDTLLERTLLSRVTPRKDVDSLGKAAVQ